MSRAMVTVPLDIPNVRIVRTEMNANNELIITIESTNHGVACPRCGQWIEKFHGHDAWVTVRRLPVFGRPTYLRYRPKRYQCLTCAERPTTTERVAWHEANSPHTAAFDTHLLLQLVNSTVEDVSRKGPVYYPHLFEPLFYGNLCPDFAKPLVFSVPLFPCFSGK
jgi:transposase